MVMVLVLPLEASAAAKTTAAADWKKAKTVKTGTTVVTIGDPRKTKANDGYVKFKAGAAKTYKFTLSNIRKYGKKSANDVLITHAGFRTPTQYGGFKTLKFKQNKKDTYSLALCSAKSRKIALSTGNKKVYYYTSLPSRTVSFKLKKGETIYISLSNTNACKISYDLKIK